jgi:hypothetical protein
MQLPYFTSICETQVIGLIQRDGVGAYLGTRTKLAAGSRHYWHAGKRAATPWRQASLPASQRGFQPRDPFAIAWVSSCAHGVGSAAHWLCQAHMEGTTLSGTVCVEGRERGVYDAAKLNHFPAARQAANAVRVVVRRKPACAR